MPLDPGTAALLELVAAAPYPPMHEGTPENARRAYRAMTVDLVTPESRVPVGELRDVDVAGRPGRLYLPAGAEGPVATLLYLHGGGFVIGDLDTHDQICRRFCAGAGVAVVAVDYRLAPEHPFPAAVEDALAALDWVHAHRGEWQGSDVVAVGGDSAGGNLSAVVSQARPDLVSAQVLIYPATHLLGDYPSREENAVGYFLEMATMTWFGAHYLGLSAAEAAPADDADALAALGIDLDDVRHSPILGDLAGQPPAVLVTAEFDPLRDEGEAYGAALRAAGVVVDAQRYDGLVHGFIDMGIMSPAAAAAVDDLVARTARLLASLG
ncbi:alpha/beta hydrolase [Nocardioides sp.]|uniref:alpha/beta hydrolase n=1 Tax=Nocardioides sp. TaxID=35761 RepID=UPI00351866C9